LVWSECNRVLHNGCRLCINIGDQFARSVYYGRYKVIPIHSEIIRFYEAIGLDFIVRFNGKYVIGKAKFLTLTETYKNFTILNAFALRNYLYQIFKIEYYERKKHLFKKFKAE
jgi:hypothetical protein